MELCAFFFFLRKKITKKMTTPIITKTAIKTPMIVYKIVGSSPGGAIISVGGEPLSGLGILIAWLGESIGGIILELGDGIKFEGGGLMTSLLGEINEIGI